MQVKKDVAAKDDFMVLDSNNAIVTGLADGDFTRKLYNPSGSEVSSSITVTISELGDGGYQADFTPNTTGDWLLIVYHATHFPEGKAANYQCVLSLNDDIASDVTNILKIEKNRWKIDNDNDQLIIYDDDGSTPLYTFNLTKESIINFDKEVTERIPV